MKKIVLISLVVNVLFVFGCESDEDGAEADADAEETRDMSEENGSDSSGDALAYTDISAEQVLTMIESDDDVVVVDVSPAYDEGHIPGAVNLYIGSTEIDDALPLIDKSFTYIIYCHSDTASITGAQKFVDAGFPNVYRLAGNWGAWTDAGYAVERTEDGYMDLSPATAKVLIDGKTNVVTIDVSPVYAQGHLPGAVNHPIGDGSLEAAVSTLDDSKIYLVYCHGDAPSIAGAELLFDEGFSPVYRLKGNYSAWTERGFPVSM